MGSNPTAGSVFDPVTIVFEEGRPRMSYAATAESDLKQIVLDNSTFGPQEIRQLIQAVSADYTQFSVLRDAVAELEVREDRTPASAVSSRPNRPIGDSITTTCRS